MKVVRGESSLSVELESANIESMLQLYMADKRDSPEGTGEDEKFNSQSQNRRERGSNAQIIPRIEF